MKAFKCLHSDLLMPADYFKEWGRKYGHGMGPIPVSQSLDTHYHLPQAEAHQPNSGVMMHPVGFRYAAIQEVDVTPEEYEKNRMILHEDDRDMSKRTAILIKKQQARKLADATATMETASTFDLSKGVMK